jgi:hypothetical protein
VSRGRPWSEGGLFPGVAALVAAVIYGPMLRPGFVLRYDLVSVPRPVLGEDALGLGDRLPRAIPLDAAIAALAKILPDAWLTQLLGLLALTLVGWGVAVLTPGPLPGRMLALLIAEWNPFVLEQLSIGHLPHLFGYAAVPWVAVFGRELTRRGGPSAWGGFTAVAGFGSLTPGGGVLVVLAGLGGLTTGWARSSVAGPTPGVSDQDARRPSPDGVGDLDERRPSPGEVDAGNRRARWSRPVPVGADGLGHRSGWLVAGSASLLVLQLPWLVAAAAAPAFAAPADGADDGVTAFALRSETGWGRLVDAAGLGGMWNQAALPVSRDTVLARVSTGLLLALAVAAAPAVRRLWRTGFRAELTVAAVVAAIGYLIAVLPVLPGGEPLLRTLIDVLPGAGLLRDGHRWLALPAIALAVLGGLGGNEIATRIARRTSTPTASPAPVESAQIGSTDAGPAATERFTSSRVEPPALSRVGSAQRAGVVLFIALLVIASMPDLAGGLAGRLRAREYPAGWAQVRQVLDRSDDRARVLVLPWQPFRVFAWSGPDPVLDPAPRLLPRQSIVSDALTVSGRTLPEEGLGARAVGADLADGRLTADRLSSLAVGWVLIERGTPGRLPTLPPGWTTALDGPDLTLLRAPLPLPSAPRPSTGRAVAVIGTQVAAGALFLAGLLTFLALVVVRRRRRPDSRERGRMRQTSH